ncbi:MAG TPA: RNA 2'-phosphotransferase [Planctomycetaceae bacterium]|nr:RNA 2'-phosphotransferase [Planctomycetaceae bacterium]|tara:strand:- start:32 stop:586 length:555 start_codon:yes stop_codon:yes gene_type:complete
MGITTSSYSRLSQKISHALRHEPWLYELELDDEGWVAAEQLLESLRLENESWNAIVEDDIAEMIRTSSKRRHEIRDGRIRAIYGHSIPNKLKRIAATPPEVLFHGTSPLVVGVIETKGLSPMSRQNVHLSIDEATALEVGTRKSKEPVLLRVRSLEAFENGIAFYEGNEKVWLADEVPPQFIEF